MAKNKVYNAANILAKWQAGMASPAAMQNYKDGVNRQTESPTIAAVADVNKNVANYTKVVTSPEYSRIMLDYPLATWKAQCVAMATRLADGARKAGPKYTRFITKFLPVWTAMKAASVAFGPSTSIAQSQAKSAAALEVLMKAGRKGAQ